MKRLLLPLFFIIVFYNASAQDASPIATDRPSQSAAASVMPEGNLLIEYGFVSEKINSDNTAYTYANFLIRYGVINGLELRIIQNYQGVRNKTLDQTESGLSPLTIGTKVHLVEANGALPQISVIGQVTLQNGDRLFRPSTATPEVRFNFANTITDRLSMGYNLGMVFPEDNATSFYTLIVGYTIADGLSVFAEPYGFFYDGVSDHRFDMGVVYLVKRNLQFDVSTGWGLSDTSTDSFIGFGAAIGF